MNTEHNVAQEAVQWARENKKVVAKELTNKDHYPGEESPVSFFMAGSPGTGKTEVSKHLIASDLFEQAIIHIEADAVSCRAGSLEN